MSLQIVKFGTKVTLANNSIKAFITAVCIRNETISYEVSYFNNGENMTCWVHRFEFEIDYKERKSAGFVNYDKPDDNGEHTLLLSSQ